MSDRHVEDVTRKNARGNAAAMTPDDLARWKRCGTQGCVFCEEIERVMATSRATTKETP